MEEHMIAYKAFSKDLRATMGNSTNFQFEAGKKNIETECKCAKNGFHCAENPLCCLTYYNEDSRFFVVKAEGDIDEDAVGSRISCTELTLIKELSIYQMGAHACSYILKHPQRVMESQYAIRNYGECTKAFLIVRGRKPSAKGKTGSVIFFLKEDKTGNIVDIIPIEIDEQAYKQNTVYEYVGGKIREKKSN